MAWLPVHQSLRDHRKTLGAARRLGIAPAQAAGHLLFLWLWALDSCPSGRLDGVEPEVVAEAAGWTGDAPAFLEALVGAGFLEGEPGAWAIHDWNDYAGRLLERREAHAAVVRARRRASVAKPCPASDRDGEGACSSRDEHVIGTCASIVQYSTAEKSTPPSAPPAVPASDEAGAEPCPPGQGVATGAQLTEADRSGADRPAGAPGLPSPGPADGPAPGEDGAEAEGGLPRRGRQEFLVFWSFYPWRQHRELTVLEWDRQLAAGAAAEDMVAGARRLAELAAKSDRRARRRPPDQFLRGAWRALVPRPPPGQ